MAIRAVAFDLDGTLYSFRHLAVRAVAFGLRNLSYARIFSRVRSRIRTMRPIDDFRSMQARMFAQETGMSREEAHVWIEERIYGDWVHSFRKIVPYRDLDLVLQELGRRGLKCAVMSDFPVAEKLEYLGLDRRFSVAMCSEESGYLKPNPEPFGLLARRLSMAPHEILFVGDSYEYDVVGAKAAGLRAAHITRRPRAGSVADIRFARYRDLLRHLDSL